MKIEFTNRRHAVSASRVAFEAVVDGRAVWCSVSFDALSDRFGNSDVSAHALVSTFDANRLRIERATREVLEKNHAQSVELETRDFK
ncbi:DUF1488 domain-containing protein [Paraburkholderia sacchari]|uniref:DUF1488 domain-containing protein n=1 Tax=Paraburkholderia sacchari TaxID=159450 RepID=UPI0005426D8B|nr:DUF1488 domain-containing protein [Paraburkholderia sacchari]NLP60291.1 DUF1488 domain-containing protein [Paraburkholderia sacchari]